MATALEQLVIEITAKDAQFAATLKQVESRLSSFEAKINASTKRAEVAFASIGNAVNVVNRAFALLGGAGALAGLTRLTKSALDTTGALVDTADRIGLSVEALQELQFAATQSGVEIGTFNSSLQIFARRLSEAASGTGDAKTVLKAFGLDAKALAQDPAKALTLIADKIAGLGSQAQRLEVINKVFGRGGAAMVNLLQQGGPALDAVREKARALGVVIDEDLARASEELGDRFEAASQAIGVQFKSALLELAPILIRTAELLAAAAKGAREFIADFDVTRLLKQGQLSAVVKNIEDIERKLSSTSGLPEGGIFGIDAAKLQKDLAVLHDKQKELTAALTDFGNVAGGSTSTAVKKLSGEFIDLSDAQEKTAEKAQKAAEQLTKQRAELEAQIASKLKQIEIQKLIASGAITEEEGLKQIAVAAAIGEKGTEDLVKQLALLDVQIAKNVDVMADLAKAQELVNKITSDKIDLDKKDLVANTESLRKLQDEIETLHEEGQLIAASLAPKADLRALELTIAKARIERQKATDIVAASENGLTEEEEKAIKSKQNLSIANAEATASFAAYAASIDDAALSTKDLKTLTQGILAGTQDISELFTDLGQTIGVRLVEGIIFGKGQNEQAIIGNFNQLLGVDAAGLFGAQGANLGQTLISGIQGPLKAAGVNLGSLFGTSFSSTAGGVISGGSSTAGGGLFGNVVAGGSSTASASGGILGSIFGAAAAGAAGLALGKGLSGIFGIGGSKSGNLGGTIGGIAGGIGGGILGSFFGPAGTAIGSALGAAVGTIFGGFIGDLFASTPSKGTQIRAGIKKFLKEIEVSFAKEIDSGDYFFAETKKLAEKMFGGDFLKASKQILNDATGPELGRQLQALGTFITADQARKLGKSVEQTGTTFGNLLLDNLGLDPKVIGGAIQEIVQEAGISFGSLVAKLNSVFDKGKISVEFYTDTIQGAVDIFFGDLPDAINVSAVALKSFTDEGIFDIKKFQEELEKATTVFDSVVNSFIDVVVNAKPGEEIGKLLGEQIMFGLESLAVDAFLADFIKNSLFKDVDLSDGLSAEELALIKTRAGEARVEVEKLWDAFGEVGKEVDKTKEKVEDLFDKILDLTRQRFELRLDVIGNLAAIGAISGTDAARARIGAFSGAVSRFANPSGLGAVPLAGFSDLELEQGVEAIRNARAAQVELFQAQENAAQDALQKRIEGINKDFEAQREALEKEAQVAQDASEDRLDLLAQEKEATQDLFQSRIDGLQAELQIAKDFRQVADSLQNTINGLVTSTSRFSGPEQLAIFQAQAASLRSRLAGASREQRPGILEDLSKALSSQLEAADDVLGEAAFRAAFDSVVTELERLRDQTTVEGNRTEQLEAQIANTTVQMEVQLRSIDASVQRAQADAQQAQRAVQAQTERLSQEEQAAIGQAEASTTAEIEALRIEAAEEIRRLAVIEDQILVEQLTRAQVGVELSEAQLTVLQNINATLIGLDQHIVEFLAGSGNIAAGGKFGFDFNQNTIGPLSSSFFDLNPSPSGPGINVTSPLTINLSGSFSGDLDPNKFARIVTQAVQFEWKEGQTGREVRQMIERKG